MTAAVLRLSRTFDEAARQAKLVERWGMLNATERRALYDALPERDQLALRETFGVDLWAKLT